MNKDAVANLREAIRLFIETELTEFSSAGAVAGFTLPLGMVPSQPLSPRKSGKRKTKKRKK